MATPTAVTQSALRITTKVLPGNKLEIQLPPDAIVGGEVDVFVVLPEPVEDEESDILTFIEAARERHAKRTAEDIDQQIRVERDSWDS